MNFQARVLNERWLIRRHRTIVHCSLLIVKLHLENWTKTKEKQGNRKAIVEQKWQEGHKGKNNFVENFCKCLHNSKIKLIRAQGGCLGIRSRRRTWQAAISCGERHIRDRSADFRMGEPGRAIPCQRMVKKIAVRGEPPELKHLSRARKRHQHEIPQVVASERGGGQTGRFAQLTINR